MSLRPLKKGVNYLDVPVTSLGGTDRLQYGHFLGTPIHSRNVMLHSLQARTGVSSAAERRWGWRRVLRSMCVNGGDDKTPNHHLSVVSYGCVLFKRVHSYLNELMRSQVDYTTL